MGNKFLPSLALLLVVSTQTSALCCCPPLLLCSCSAKKEIKAKQQQLWPACLTPFIGKIICAAPVHTSYFDAMSNDEGSNNHDAESALMGEGEDLDCEEAFSVLNLPNCVPFGNACNEFGFH